MYQSNVQFILTIEKARLSSAKWAPKRYKKFILTIEKARPFDKFLSPVGVSYGVYFDFSKIMKFGDLVSLYEDYQKRYGEKSFQYISKMLREAKQIHKESFEKSPRAQKDFNSTMVRLK
ncbi:MAG: hypothetical protein NZM39_11205, partial [Bernardetiaceae bacterium]|nr:hypothetical protein [Bernardetiaceae bacterium]